MALPYSFSNNTSPTGPQLDANQAALGAQGIIPCTASGTNTVVMTPNANTSTVSAYANYARFSSVASATNTGPVVARVGALSLLPVYWDSPSGPIALTGGEIRINCAFTLIYDSTLNAGNGGFHLISMAPVFSNAGGIVNGPITVTDGTTSVVLSATGLVGPSVSVTGILKAASATVTNLFVGASAATVTRILSTLGTVSYTVIPANTSQVQNMTLAGVQVNDAIMLGPPATVTTGLGFTGFVPAAGTVSVRALNITAASIAAFSLTMRATAVGSA